MANRVVTIGRQCGSGGHTIGKLVAQRLGVSVEKYQKDLARAALNHTLSLDALMGPSAISSATAPASAAAL